MSSAMAQSKKRGPGRPRRIGPTPVPPPATVASSLPPTQLEPLVTSPSFVDDTPQHPALTRSPTKREATGMHIVALRISGKSEEEIAEMLGLQKPTLAGYVYLASKNGWLDLPTAKEAINYNLIPKAVKRMYEGLDHEGTLANGLPVRFHMATKIAEGTVFKEYDKVVENLGAQVVAIKIEMPAGPTPPMREDTIGGTPAYVDAEVTHGTVDRPEPGSSPK